MLNESEVRAYRTQYQEYDLVLGAIRSLRKVGTTRQIDIVRYMTLAYGWGNKRTIRVLNAASWRDLVRWKRDDADHWTLHYEVVE